MGDDELRPPPGAANGPSSPSPWRFGSSPPQVRRPTRIEPTWAGCAAARASSEPMKRVSQSIPPPGPAMNPSSDIVAVSSSFAILATVPSVGAPRPG
jgi:hypothetical protein